MTREHKLALIVGFALLLLVGVLISDHLSAARSSKIDTVAPELVLSQAPVREAPIDPLGPIGGPEPEQRASSNTQPAPQPTTTAGAPAVPDSLSDAIERAGSQPRIVEPVLGGSDLLRDAIVANGGRIVPGADGNDVIEVVTGSGVQPPAAAAIEPNPAPATNAAPKASDRTHKVKKNETLFAIAKQYYGDAKLWPRLAEYNKLGKGGEVREGAVIRIPSETALTGKPESAAPSSTPATPSPRTPAADTRIAKASTYTVRDGDTLGEIARKVLGTSKRWPDLVRANKLDDEDHLLVGMVLRVPQP